MGEVKSYFSSHLPALPLFSSHLPCCAFIFSRTYPAVPFLILFSLTLLVPVSRFSLPFTLLRPCYFIFTYPAVPFSRFSLPLTLLCSCSAPAAPTLPAALTLLRPYFSSHSRCARKEKKLGHRRVSKKQDNGTAEVSVREKKITAQQGKCLKKNLAHSRVSAKRDDGTER